MHEDLHRPSIKNNMMHSQEQYMLFVCQLQQERAHKWPTSQLKGLLSLLLAQTLYLCCPFSLSNRTQIHRWQGDSERCCDELLGFALRHDKGGTQDLVTAHNVVDARLQCAQREGTVQM